MFKKFWLVSLAAGHWSQSSPSVYNSGCTFYFLLSRHDCII